MPKARVVPESSRVRKLPELFHFLHGEVFHAAALAGGGAFHEGPAGTELAAGGDVNAKIVRRHPHVFGDVVAGDANEVLDVWDQIKMAEKESADAAADAPQGLRTMRLGLFRLKCADSVF